jgi:hypothetical protein
MSLIWKTLSALKNGFRRARKAGPVPRRSRLELEALESRELLAAGLAIGMNLENVRDYMAAWMFTDVFKESRPWIPEIYNGTTHTVTLDTGHLIPLSLDANGWPTQLGQTINAQGQDLHQVLASMMLDGLGGHYPAGTYTAWWQGTGTLQWGGDATVIGQGTRPDGTHYALLSDPTPGNLGIQLRIVARSAGDPVHNIHVWMPDYQGQSFVGQVWHPGAGFSPFYPLFLQRLQPFGTLRFMQMQETITSQVQHWSDLKTVDYETQATSAQTFQNGIAPEYMIEMANELGANIWVNMPHLADDDFIRHFATLVRDTLKPNLQVDVEWSNEVWNRAPGFLPYQWVIQQLALPQNAGLTFTQFVAREDRRTFDIWSQVFAGQTHRLVRVVAGFEENPRYTAQVLQAMNGDFDAVSCAAYFGPSSQQEATYSAATTETQVMNDTIASIPNALNFLARHKQLADQYAAALGRPVQLVAYEGGASLIGRYRPFQAAYLAASSDPRMYDAYRQLLTGANALGLNLFVNYVYTERFGNNPYGDFGALSYQDEPVASAPKYRALLDAAGGVFFS